MMKGKNKTGEKSIFFLASGGGGNMKFIHQIGKFYGLSVDGVIADRECGALEYASIHSIPNSLHSFKKEELEEDNLIKILNFYRPDYVVTNIHKIISPRILKLVPSEFVNLHYSYLPAYQGLIGMKPLRRAIDRGNRFAAVTCHHVTDVLDDGDTISQAFFPIHDKTKDENIQTCFEAGALTLLAGLIRKSTQEESYSQIFFKDVIVSPGFNIISGQLIDEAFKLLKNS